MRGHSNHERCPQPDREYSELNGRRDADQVAAAGVVGDGQPGGDANNRRYGKAAQRALESGKKNRSTFDPGNDRTGSNREQGTDDKSPDTLHNEATIPVPQAEADSQHLREEGQEDRRYNNSDRVVFNNPVRQQDRPGCGAGDIAGGYVAHSPEILDSVRERVRASAG